MALAICFAAFASLHIILPWLGTERTVRRFICCFWHGGWCFLVFLAMISISFIIAVAVAILLRLLFLASMDLLYIWRQEVEVKANRTGLGREWENDGTGSLRAFAYLACVLFSLFLLGGRQKDGWMDDGMKWTLGLFLYILFLLVGGVFIPPICLVFFLIAMFVGIGSLGITPFLFLFVLFYPTILAALVAGVVCFTLVLFAEEGVDTFCLFCLKKIPVFVCFVCLPCLA